ncbi:MAG: PHP domain-containing protein [Myxococcales bacterium]|nr:PHP domain-containing protein [Myxococcales bacterium]
MIDLHVHTHASADAQHSPRELFAMAREIGVTTLSFADHNTLAALPAGRELAGETGIEFIPAVELNTELDGRELHLLGYGIADESPAVREWFGEIERLFLRQAERRVRRLTELGLRLTLAAVQTYAAGRLPTGSSFLDALNADPANHRHPLLAPYREGPKAADPYVNFYFDVLAKGGPADVGGESLPFRAAVARLRELRAVPVLAHPRDLPATEFATAVAAGLRGVEAICSYHDPVTARRWLEAAAHFRLLPTAGSDFHGARTKAAVKLGDLPGADETIVVRLRAAIADANA